MSVSESEDSDGFLRGVRVTFGVKVLEGDLRILRIALSDGTDPDAVRDLAAIRTWAQPGEDVMGGGVLVVGAQVPVIRGLGAPSPEGWGHGSL